MDRKRSIPHSLQSAGPTGPGRSVPGGASPRPKGKDVQQDKQQTDAAAHLRLMPEHAGGNEATGKKCKSKARALTKSIC